MIKNIVYFVILFASLRSYSDVSNNFSGKGFCPDSKKIASNNNLTNFNEILNGYCSSSNSEYEIIIDEYLNKINKNDFLIYDLIGFNSLFDINLLSCFDSEKYDILTNNINFRVIEALNDKSIYYKYAYFFIKALNDFITFFRLITYILFQIILISINNLIFTIINLLF
tara:strand:+ start:655 stop:1161 length:507 start_codon:yes stop_codon:yes gene_type:complete